MLHNLLNDPQFWVFVAFVLFVATIFKPVRKMLTLNLDNKINEIKENIDQAEKIKNEAQQTLSEIKKRQNNMKQEIQTIQNEAKEKITLIEKNFTQKLEELIKKRDQVAKAKIKQMTRDANIHVQQYIIQNATNAIINILSKKLDSLEKQKLINQSIKELQTALN